MERKKFLSIFHNIDVYQCLFSSGILVAPKQVNGKYLYIIGLDISYDTIDWLLYNKFTIVTISDKQILSVYRSIKGEDKLKKKLDQKLTVHNLLHEILLTVSSWEHSKLLATYFGLTKLKQYSSKEISKLVDLTISKRLQGYNSQVHDNQQVGYLHIDINAGLRFYGEPTYDLNGNLLS